MNAHGEILRKFQSLTIWNKGSERAPHKPLLCLQAVADLTQGKSRLQPFSETLAPLTSLLIEFGPPRKVIHPEYPFWALQNDGLWEVESNAPIELAPGAPPTKAGLLRSGARGGFRPEVFQILRDDQTTRSEVIGRLLETHFPPTLHEDILLTLGLNPFTENKASSARDPLFRERILSAYEYRCAVCGFNVRVGQTIIALEAAHIRWHQYGGPDLHENGIALCSLHHKLFDRGAFTIDYQHRALVSEKAYGTGGFDEHLGQYHRKPLTKPVRESYRPRHEFLDWHGAQVFFQPARE